LGAALLLDGHLEIFDLTDHKIKNTVFVGQQPQAVIPAGPRADQVYVSLENGLALVDLFRGQVSGRWTGPGRWRGLALDESGSRLFAADAAGERLLVLRADLAQPLASTSLPAQPDRLIFDPATRQLYISFPAGPQMVAVDGDTLEITAQTSLAGGPILDLAFDPARGRLYLLSAQAPGYRGLNVLETPTLAPLRLVAGAAGFPLRTAAALAVTPGGHLLLPETTGLGQVAPADFSVNTLQPGTDLSFVSQIIAGQTGEIFTLEPIARQIRIYR
jgi:hypothetical protein